MINRCHFSLGGEIRFCMGTTHPNWHLKFLIKKQFRFIDFTYKLWLRFTLKQMCLILLHTTKLF